MSRIKNLSIAAVLAVTGLTLPGLSTSASGSTVDEYAALGDSYSAGNGAFSTNLDYGCGRNTYAYPYLVAQARPNTHLTFVACQGAVTSDVVAEQVPVLNADTDYVSLTVGGNDIGFADLIINCAGYWSFNCENAVNTARAKINNELPAKLDSTYAAISNNAPNATVVVLGYSRFFGKSISCSSASGIASQEATMLNDLTDLLDTTIAGRAAAAGFTYKSSITSFRNHELCTKDPWLNGSSWSIADGYHPTRSGYANGLAPAVRAVIG